MHKRTFIFFMHYAGFDGLYSSKSTAVRGRLRIIAIDNEIYESKAKEDALP